MLTQISRFCTRFPWIVFSVIAGITIFMVYQITNKSTFEADITKFLPSDLAAIKSDDYYKKNFNYQDTLLIGLENESGSVLEMPILRLMESLTFDLKEMSAQKTFYSKLKGESVTLTQSMGIDPDTVSAAANLEDAILDKETGSVISGSVIKKLKKDRGIVSASGKEDLLPESDSDLKLIIPDLKEHIMRDSTFRGSILSVDLKAATIRAATIRRWTYKKRYAESELSAAIDENILKQRFSGKDSTFPFEIYGKTIDKTEINDAYIVKHTADVKIRLKEWLTDYFEDVLEDEPGLRDLLNREMTPGNLQAILNYQERNDFYDTKKLGTWANFTNDIYAFTLENIDPFSRENLEFQLYDVKDIYSLTDIYHKMRVIIDNYETHGVKVHLGGFPVLIGVINAMMPQDMRTMIPIAIVVILLILFISFRSLRGVLIPTVTVVLSVIWSLGVMAISGTPFTMSTSMLPIIILAVGTAYGIHLVNRYYEDAAIMTDKQEVIVTSVKSVGVAVIMAGITTIAGFGSLATANLAPIQHFGIFSAVGVISALILSLTMTPAMLMLWKLPKKTIKSRQDDPSNWKDPLSKTMRSWTGFVTARPAIVVIAFTLVIVASAALTSRNYFEGGMMSNFKKNSPIAVGDRFINKNLTGTTNINIIFTFRDQMLLEEPQARSTLQKQVSTFAKAWETYSLENNTDKNTGLFKLGNQLQSTSENLPETLSTLINQIKLTSDILNEEYSIETTEPRKDASGITSTSTGLDSLEEEGESEASGLDDLEEEAETDKGGTSAVFADLSEESVAGLKSIHKRVTGDEKGWEESGKMILTLRKFKKSAAGIQTQYELNLLQDLLSMDIKQPQVLKKLEQLYVYLKNMEEPKVVIEGKTFKPTGFVMTPVDFVRRFYKVFYHDSNPAFDRLPDVKNDGFTDKTLTDRSIIGVVLNQALSANRDMFSASITPNLKEFQVQAMIRGGSQLIVESYTEKALEEVRRLFPENDPYIETVRIGGAAMSSVQMSKLISSSQLRSIVLSFVFVFIVTFFIFRSAQGGLYSLIPLGFTVVLNFGLLALLGGEITMSTMLVASIAIGIGVDYTIHFLERFKAQLGKGDTLTDAYTNTALTAGRAILVNAAAVALGFIVLLFSQMLPTMMMGLLMFATMVFSSLASLTLLPAIILLTKPKFLAKAMVTPLAEERKN